jgi:hypothetical protein
MSGETKENQNNTCIRIASLLAKILKTGPHECEIAVIPIELQCHSKADMYFM